MSCINFSVLVYPLSFPSASCTSRTVLAPWRHSTARMAISESVGSGGGSGSLERAREAMRGEHYTNFFVCQRNNSYVRLITVMNMPPVGRVGGYSVADDRRHGSIIGRATLVGYSDRRRTTGSIRTARRSVNSAATTVITSSTIQPAANDDKSKALTRNRSGCRNGVVANAADVQTIKPSTTGHPSYERISRRTCV